MGDHHVPSIRQKPKHVALNVLPWLFCKQQVATPSIPSAFLERIADNSAKLASYEYSWHESLLVGPQRVPAYKAKLFPLVIFRVKFKNQNRSAYFPDAKMFPGQNSWGKFTSRNCPGRFAKARMFWDR